MELNKSEIIELFSNNSNCKVINGNTRINALNFDSLHFIEIIIFIENKYGISFQPEDMVLSKYKNINEFLNHIAEVISN